MKCSILIVEDETITALFLKMQFIEAGYNIIDTVTNAKNAILIAESTNPDVILMDVMLAGKTDGIDAANTILKSVNTKIIFMTGYNDSKNKIRMEAIEPLGMFEKPIDMQKLNKLIQTL